MLRLYVGAASHWDWCSISRAVVTGWRRFCIRFIRVVAIRRAGGQTIVRQEGGKTWGLKKMQQEGVIKRLL